MPRRDDAATAAPGVAAAAVACPGSPATSGPDVQIVVSLENGGDPGTVKIVALIINQAHPNSPSNTILVGVGPCDNDKYEALAAMMETHLPQIDALLRDGVMVHGARRPVRLMFRCDCDAQCYNHGEGRTVIISTQFLTHFSVLVSMVWSVVSFSSSLRMV